MKFDTRLIHAGIQPDKSTGAIVPPIYQTTTYVMEKLGQDKEFDYTRCSNPTRAALEENLAIIEAGKYGISFASGMAAIDSAIRLLSQGDHVIASLDMYGGTYRLFGQIAIRHGLQFSYVDTSIAENIIPAIRPNTKMIWIETPSNPFLKITDIEAVSRIAKKYNILLSVDSTIASPYLLQPLKWDVDLVIHSTTKYLSGHNQIIGGAVITKNEDLYNQLKYIQKSAGAVSSPFDCWLTLMGIKTLSLRMERHSSNALAVARFLENHSKIKRVIYPGLPTHPHHSLAKSQMRDFSGLITFELKGDVQSAKTLITNLKLSVLANSLGAVETMIAHPASMTHREMSPELKIRLGLTDTLLRISVGIEDVDDIIDDLKFALNKVIVE